MIVLKLLGNSSTGASPGAPGREFIYKVEDVKWQASLGCATTMSQHLTINNDLVPAKHGVCVTGVEDANYILNYLLGLHDVLFHIESKQYCLNKLVFA